MSSPTSHPPSLTLSSLPNLVNLQPHKPSVSGAPAALVTPVLKS